MFRQRKCACCRRDRCLCLGTDSMSAKGNIINRFSENERKENAVMQREINVEEIEALIRRTKPYFYNQEQTGTVTIKGRADFVTAADVAIQTFLQEELSRLYPEIQFMSEEKDNTEVDPSGAVWILDPVDGTSNLIHDLHMSALSLALCENGEVTLAFIYQPFLEEMFFARKGAGAWCNHHPISVSRETCLEKSIVAVGTSPYHRELAEQNFAAFRRIFDSCADIRRMGAASIDLAYVACGRTEAYFERNLKAWDFAAGLLLVEEAGGCVTDMKGRKPNPLQPADIIAGNGCIEKLLLELI